MKACLYIPFGLNGAKAKLFDDIAKKIGLCVRASADPATGVATLAQLPSDMVPVVGCSPELTKLIASWRATGRKWIYWDRGYARRVYATNLGKGSEIGVEMGYYRWHVDAFQMQTIRDVPSDRWDALKQPLVPWRKGGRHILIARGSDTYNRFHDLPTWLDDTVRKLARLTDRPLLVRDKEHTVDKNLHGRVVPKRTLQEDLRDAWAVVTHGSNTAIEAAILGVPVFCDPCCAAALIGRTDLRDIESPVYPEREKWAHSLAYSQFTEAELVDGTLWRLLR